MPLNQQKAPQERGKGVRMRNPFVVKKGIYIDMGCAGIRNVEEGIFIPTGYHTSESLPKFQEDLAAFLKKWFPNEGGDTKDSFSTSRGS